MFEQIAEKIQDLPKDKQQEVLTFVEFLLQKNIKESIEKENQERNKRNHFSIDQAMKGLEYNDIEYTLVD